MQSSTGKKKKNWHLQRSNYHMRMEKTQLFPKIKLKRNQFGNISQVKHFFLSIPDDCFSARKQRREQLCVLWLWVAPLLSFVQAQPPSDRPTPPFCDAASRPASSPMRSARHRVQQSRQMPQVVRAGEQPPQTLPRPVTFPPSRSHFFQRQQRFHLFLKLWIFLFQWM